VGALGICWSPLLANAGHRAAFSVRITPITLDKHLWLACRIRSFASIFDLMLPSNQVMQAPGVHDGR